jgi:DNA-binding Lrp family transcriptional regulator
MLRRFLETIQAGDVQSLQEVARTLGVSLAMVLQMAKELTDKGYLQEIGADCEEPQTGCADCPVSSGCHAVVRHWFMTEKGKAAVSGSGMSK